MIRVMIAGGGTGGHLFPGVAVAQAIQKAAPDAKIVFVGTKRGIEARVIPELGYELRTVTVGGLKRMGLWRTFINLMKLPLSILQSLWFVLSFRPHIAIGVGGYASGPAMLAAWMLMRPSMILEQNSVPGRTNRILSKFVRKIVINFERAAGFFPAKKIARLGNPVRLQMTEKLESANRDIASDERLHIFITGGSQGAQAINKAVTGALEHISDLKDKLEFFHQTGEAQREEIAQAYAKAGFKAEVKAFIDEVWNVYDWSDFVICRAGATTCSELGVVGRAALFIPLPTAADNHQTHNAGELEAAGAAWVVTQKELSPEKLAHFIRERLENKDELKFMGAKAQAWGKPSSAHDVADLSFELSGLDIKGGESA